MKCVIVESPYAGNVENNKKYARMAMKDCLDKGEAPYASHLLYTQTGVLDDSVPDEREKGIQAGFEWARRAERRVVYVDYGISTGMCRGIKSAFENDQPLEFRRILKDRPLDLREFQYEAFDRGSPQPVDCVCGETYKLSVPEYVWVPRFLDSCPTCAPVGEGEQPPLEYLRSRYGNVEFSRGIMSSVPKERVVVMEFWYGGDVRWRIRSMLDTKIGSEETLKDACDAVESKLEDI